MMLPAHAGMILRTAELINLRYNVTRTRGDDPIIVNTFFI